MSMRVASAHSARACPPSPRLSLDDLYKLAERTRMRTTLESRHLVLTRSQKLFRSKTFVPQTDTRPSTRTDSDIGGLTPRKRDAATSVDEGDYTPRSRRTVSDNTGDDRGDDSALGFVSNVQISYRPRPRHIYDYSSYVAAYSSSGQRLTITTAGSASGAMVSPECEDEDGENEKTTSPVCTCTYSGTPRTCEQCRTLRGFQRDAERLQASLPPLHVPEKRITTSALVRRVLPDMTQAEIQDKLASGEISQTNLIFPRRRCHDRNNEKEENMKNYSEDEEGEKLSPRRLSPEGGEVTSPTGSDERRDRHSPATPPERTAGVSGKGSAVTSPSATTLTVLAKMKLRLRGEATTPLYFTDLKHMNSKIFHGVVGRTMGLPLNGRGSGKGGRRRTGGSVSASDPSLLWPAFVSPRKVKMLEEPKYRAFYGPPLLPKRQQVYNPAFFAGSKNTYSLPERLPEVLEFSGGAMAITDPNVLISENSSSSLPLRPSVSSPSSGEEFGEGPETARDNQRTARKDGGNRAKEEEHEKRNYSQEKQELQMKRTECTIEERTEGEEGEGGEETQGTIFEDQVTNRKNGEKNEETKERMKRNENMQKKDEREMERIKYKREARKEGEEEEGVEAKNGTIWEDQTTVRKDGENNEKEEQNEKGNHSVEKKPEKEAKKTEQGMEKRTERENEDGKEGKNETACEDQATIQRHGEKNEEKMAKRDKNTEKKPERDDMKKIELKMEKICEGEEEEEEDGKESAREDQEMIVRMDGEKNEKEKKIDNKYEKTGNKQEEGEVMKTDQEMKDRQEGEEGNEGKKETACESGEIV